MKCLFMFECRLSLAVPSGSLRLQGQAIISYIIPSSRSISGSEHFCNIHLHLLTKSSSDFSAFSLHDIDLR